MMLPNTEINFENGPDAATMRGANVNPATGLATDYLNHFNEYIMLAELVENGSMDPEVLADWQPLDYESHFVQSGFVGLNVVLAAYRALAEGPRTEFEDATNVLIELILDHQDDVENTVGNLDDIRTNRDHVASMISTAQPHIEVPTDDTQAAIDALFD